MSVLPLSRWVVKTRKTILWVGLPVGLAIVLAPRLTSWFPFTFPFAHSAQDACSFGPVSNAQYRAMLSKARSIERWTWLSPKSAEEVLLKQFREVSDSSASPDVKIAAMHAVFRALGADFRNTNADDETYARVAKGGGQLAFSYAIAVTRIGVISLPGNAWLIGSLKGPKHPSIPYTSEAASYRKGGFSFTVHFPNPFDPVPDVQWRGQRACPQVPPDEFESIVRGN